jgi:dihydropyrimidinase
MEKILLQGGELIGAEGTVRKDLLIEGERIAAVEPGIQEPGAARIDVTGKFVLPGGIDPHTHFDLPMFNTVSSDDHYTGHKAAAFGGTTTVMDFVPLEAGGLMDSVTAWRAKADPKAAIDFGFHMNITRWDNQTQAQFAELLEAGIPTVKMFTAYNNRLRLGDAEIFQVMRRCAALGMLPMLHAENGDVIELLVREALAAGHTAPVWHALTRPAWGAVESILRGISLAAQAGSPLYLVHMNTAGGLDQLRYGRGKALPVMGETCPQYLFFTVDDLRRPDGAKWVCSPPMRTAEDNRALWTGLEDRSLQIVATDHCPFFYDGTTPIEYEGRRVAIPGKELGADDFTKIPNGLPAVGDRMPILWTFGVGAGRISPNRFVELTSTNPAKIFGLYPRKGSLEVGADADLVVWDPDRELTYGVKYARHRTDYNLWEGWKLRGFPEKVFLRGQLIVDGDRWLGRPGMGRFLPREPGAAVL